MQNKLQVMPLLVRNRKPLQHIETDDLTSSLAKTLKDVPALALAMDRKSLSALSATDRSCYHAVGRHELWRDMWEPTMRQFSIGPLPATPAWLSNRDVYLSLRATLTTGRALDGTKQPRAWYDVGPLHPFGDAGSVASANCRRAAGRPTIEEILQENHSTAGFIESLRSLMRQYASVIGAVNKGVLVSLVFFCLLIISLAHFDFDDDSL